MTDVVLLSCFVMFIALGCLAPFVWSLGYVWVDALLPQQLSYGLLNAVPMAFIMGAGAVFSYLMLDRRFPPRMSATQVLSMILAVWITLTSVWSIVPVQAWYKWDASFKTLVFTIFLPYVFRTRVQIEAFVLVLLLATAPHLLPWGFKTFLSGGGYGMSLGLLGSNAAWIAESSAIAAIAIMFIPLLGWLRQHSLLVPWPAMRTVAHLGMSAAYLVATIGTYARTGIVSIGLLGIGMLIRSKRKIMFIFIAAMAGALVLSVTSDKWTERVNTVRDYKNESSANTRILVWTWTWEFAKTHPFGGGFNVFYINRISEPGPDGEEIVQFGRAFHNVYFAALGEHGYPGLALYVTTLLTAVLNMQSIIRRTKGRPDLEWAGDLARAGQLGLLILIACGFFIDISFSFVLWDLVALSTCLRGHVQRVLSLNVAQPGAVLAPATRPGLVRPLPAQQFRSP